MNRDRPARSPGFVDIGWREFRKQHCECPRRDQIDLRIRLRERIVRRDESMRATLAKPIDDLGRQSADGDMVRLTLPRTGGIGSGNGVDSIKRKAQNRPRISGRRQNLTNSIAEKTEWTRAETVGFEPTVPREGHSTLAGWCTKPNYATSPWCSRCKHTVAIITALGHPEEPGPDAACRPTGC